MKVLFLMFTALATAITLSGCIIVNDEHGWYDSWEHDQENNREAIAELDIGMHREDVLDRLSTPEFSEAYSRDGEEYRVLFFRTQHRHSDGETTRDETTPLVFRNDILIGWGDEIYVSVR
jgi:hypothetical protein